MSLVTQLSPLGFFVAGLAASGHCVMMCSPLIAMSANAASPVASDQAKMPLWLPILGLQLGRIVGYTTMGVLVGLFGAEFAATIQPEFIGSIRLGLLLLMTVGIAHWLYVKPKRQQPCRHSAVSNIGHSPFIRGLLLALMPCPLLFTVLVYCALLASPLVAGLSMLSFAVAASLLPALVALGLQRWQHKYWPYSKKVAALSLIALAIGMGVWGVHWGPQLVC